MKAKISTPLAGVVFSIVSISAVPAYAYETWHSWCGKFNLNASYDRYSFEGRGFSSEGVGIGIATAAAWWSEVQATLRWNSPLVEMDGDIIARCVEEGASAGDYAVTNRYCGWHPSCSITGCKLDSWDMVVTSNLWGSVPCGSAPGWGYTRADFAARKPMFTRLMAHELGHAFGLDHSEDVYAIMNGPAFLNDTRINNDDADGVIIGLGEGKDTCPARTALARYVGTGSGGWPLAFGSVQTVSSQTSSVLWGPAIAGDPTPSWTGRDYVLAWVDSDYRINIASASDTSSSDLNSGMNVTNVNRTYETTRAPVSLAVAPNGGVAVAWSGGDYYRTVNVTISLDGGATWAKSVFYGHSAMNGVSVAWDGTAGTWLVTWVIDTFDGAVAEDGTPFATLVGTKTSFDYTGTSWQETGYYPGVAMEGMRPAVRCGDINVGKCLLLWTDFTIAHRPLAMMNLHWSGRHPPISAPVTMSGTYYNPNLTYLPAETGRSAAYLATYSSGVSAGRMYYRIIRESDLQSITNGGWGPDERLSRSGYSGAWNYRTGKMRFVWKAD